METSEFQAEYISTGATVEWGDIVTSNNGNRYTFIEAIAPNRVKVWDGANGVYRTFYAAHVFGMCTRAI